jgi:SSS family solute:Na+ symporter
VTFLGKALRSTLAVLVILMFYVPRFGSRAGALVSILGSLVGTVGWFLAGDPFGIDNAYIAIAVPIVVMVIADVVRRTTGRGGEALGAAARAEAGAAARAGADDDGARAGADDAVRAPRT